jgi:hypothetical protein
MKPKFKPPGPERLKLKCDEPPWSSAFKFNLRHYTAARMVPAVNQIEVGPARNRPISNFRYLASRAER